MSFFANCLPVALTGVPPGARLSQAEREAVVGGRCGAVAVSGLCNVNYGPARKDLGHTPGSGGEAGSGRKQ